MKRNNPTTGKKKAKPKTPAKKGAKPPPAKKGVPVDRNRITYWESVVNKRRTNGGTKLAPEAMDYYWKNLREKRVPYHDHEMKWKTQRTKNWTKDYPKHWTKEQEDEYIGDQLAALEWCRDGRELAAWIKAEKVKEKAIKAKKDRLKFSRQTKQILKWRLSVKHMLQAEFRASNPAWVVGLKLTPAGQFRALVEYPTVLEKRGKIYP